MLRDDTYHNRWASSAALRLAGVQADSDDPTDGEIGRDLKTGTLVTGIAIEAASGLVERALAASGHYTRLRRWTAPRWRVSISVLNTYGVHRLHRRRQHAADHGRR